MVVYANAPVRSLKTRDDINNIKCKLLKRIAFDYVETAKKNPSEVPLQAMVNKHIDTLCLLGWRYAGIGRLVEKLESGLIFIGLVLALVFPHYVIVFGIVAVVGFVVLKINASFFDYEAARQILTNESLIFIKREIGQFFAGHTAAAIVRFTDELEKTLIKQSEMFTAAIKLMNDNMVTTFADLSQLSNLAELSNLKKAVNTVAESNDRYAAHHQEYMEQSQIIKQSQAALEMGLASYESTLKNLVATMGDGLGTYIQLHSKSSADAISAGIGQQINRITESNQETLRAITALINQLNEQSNNVSAHLRVLHDRMLEG
jgi:hypothetical protein